MLCLGFPLTPKQAYLCPQNRSKTSKIVDALAVSYEYTSKILGQELTDVSIRPLLGLEWKHWTYTMLRYNGLLTKKNSIEVGDVHMMQKKRLL